MTSTFCCFATWGAICIYFLLDPIITIHIPYFCQAIIFSILFNIQKRSCQIRSVFFSPPCEVHILQPSLAVLQRRSVHLRPQPDYLYTSFFSPTGPRLPLEIEVSAFSQSPLNRVNNFHPYILSQFPVLRKSLPRPDMVSHNDTVAGTTTYMSLICRVRFIRFPWPKRREKFLRHGQG